MLESINPYTNELIRVFEEYSDDKTKEIIEDCNRSFFIWKNIEIKERSELMKKASSILRERKSYYAEIMAKEMGKPVVEGKSEIEKCALVCDYYAENAEFFLKAEEIKTEALKSYVKYEPLGVILGVMPWNFPFWQVFRFAVPALMAGNVCILKHASNVQMCAFEIENIFKEAGFPKNVFRNLSIGSKKIEYVIKNDHIKAISLTGSNSAGESVAAISGKEIKKCVLELGGSDPFIILEDADLEQCAINACKGRLLNSGQSCIAAKRFIVNKNVENKFIELFKKEMEKFIIGNPLEEKTQIGPLARKEFAHQLHAQINESLKLGAKLIAGGSYEGNFYTPTIIANVKKGTPAYDEEIFGPVACVITAENDEDAIRIANDTQYGLGASIWTRNIEKAEKMAENIESGCVFINSIVRSDPRLPFGGIKKSGYGRELSKNGIMEFVNVKTVLVNP